MGIFTYRYGDKAMSAQDILNNIGLIIPGLAGLFLASRALFRRFLRDTVETAKDRAEVDILDMYRKDIAELRLRNSSLEKEKSEAINSINDLTVELISVKSKLLSMQEELNIMRVQVVKQNELLEQLLRENHELRTGEKGGG